LEERETFAKRNGNLSGYAWREDTSLPDPRWMLHSEKDNIPLAQMWPSLSKLGVWSGGVGPHMRNPCRGTLNEVAAALEEAVCLQ